MAAKTINRKNATDSLVKVEHLAMFKKNYDTVINDAMNLKQDKTDNALETSAKTITGAINEVNSKAASAYHFKGSVASKADLPSTGQADGDVYNINGEQQPDYGMNYAWTTLENRWDELGSIVDLTKYATKQEVTDEASAREQADTKIVEDMTTELAKKQKTLSAGTNITLTDKGDTVEIAAEGGTTTVAFNAITGDPYDNNALKTALDAKQGTLTAGTCIDISNNTISVSNFATKEDIDAIFE